VKFGNLFCVHLVCSGHMLDPDELPGLAHFCEHMLFLGTKKVTYLQFKYIMLHSTCHWRI